MSDSFSRYRKDTAACYFIFLLFYFCNFQSQPLVITPISWDLHNRLNKKATNYLTQMFPSHPTKLYIRPYFFFFPFLSIYTHPFIPSIRGSVTLDLRKCDIVSRAKNNTIFCPLAYKTITIKIKNKKAHVIFICPHNFIILPTELPSFITRPTIKPTKALQIYIHMPSK